MRDNSVKKNLFLSFFIIALACLTLGFAIAFYTKKEVVVRAESVSTEYGEYLSNLNPISSSIGYGSLKNDANIDGNTFSLIVAGEKKYFVKSILAHATSTLIYDIGESHPYEFFSAYVGIDAAQDGKGSVKFSIYSSIDNETWQTQLEPVIKTSGDEATFVEFSISGVRYLKFVFDSNGSNNYDHSGLGDCKLYTANYNFEQDEFIKSVGYYDDLFNGQTAQSILENNALSLMQRKFVDAVGYDNLRYSFLKGEDEPERRAMLNWLYSDEKALRDFVTGGKPNGGNYINALKVLTRLYTAHKDDLSDTTALFEPEAGSTRNRGDVYRTMMISIALTNAKSVYGWINSSTILDPLDRYEAFKFTYLAEDYHLRYDIFENLCVEEMRYLMSSRINSEEIYWLNAYATIKYGSATYPSVYSPHRHIKYGRDWNYAEKGYYLEENFSKYDEKYMLTKYGMSYSTSPRLWMAMEGSQICWGISYLGTNFASAFGVPSHYVRQPDHAAFLVYDKDSSGRTVWSIDNDIFGWTKTWMNEDTVGNGNNRMMCDWGTTGDEQVKHSNGTYILLASTALDNQENYEKAELVLSLKSMTSADEQENLFRYALSFMPYHLDAWLELIKLYINTNKTDQELFSLAEEISQEMYCFPLPMHELIGLIETELITRNTESSLIQLANVRNIDNIALQKATKVNDDENAKKLIAQTSPCIQEAKYLLGLVEDEKFVSFSFDGENKNKLIFDSKYTNVRYSYSLDGGNTWASAYTSADNLYRELTETELNSLTSENDIYIWLEGWGTINLEKAFKIDILDGAIISNLEENDNENKFFGSFDKLEYSLDNIVWQDLTEEICFEGKKTVFVRNRRSGTTLQGATSTFEFIDNTNDERSYIPISKLELYDFSSEEQSRNDYAKYAIDGKLSTRWHTQWKGGDNERYIAIKLDTNRYISGIDYTSVGGNGTMLACSVYVSADGSNWTLATSVSGWANDSSKKSLTFTPICGQYVKIVGTNTIGGFCSARLIEFFEDVTLASEQISSLELVDLPVQNVYVKGQKINYSGLKAQIVFSENKKAVIPNELLTLDEITFSQLGTQKVTIKYNQTFEATFEVKVIDEADGVARVGENYYSSLENALLNVMDGDVVDLLKDVKVSQEYAITQKITINGNGHTLTRDDSYLSAIFTVSGSLTLNNLTIDGGAVWTGEVNEILGRGTTNSGIIATSPLIKLVNNSILLLDDCTLQNNYNNYSSNAQNTGGAIFMGSQSTATISNATIKDCYSFLFGSAIYERDYASLTIVSGIFTGNSGNANKDTTVICVDNNSTCVVNGGEFCNNLANSKGGAFWVSNGRLEINGGKFSNNYATKGAGVYLNGNAQLCVSDFETMEEIYLPNGKKVYLLGMLLGKELNIKMANTDVDTIVAICEDDEIKYKVLRAIRVDDKVLYVDENNIKIADDNAVIASILSAEQEICFTSLIQAINCAESGDTINLKNNIAVSEPVYIEKVLTINLSNYLLDGIENLKTNSLCKVVYADNLVKVCDHIYNLSIAYTWNDDNTLCTAYGVCECGEEHTEVASATATITTPASYTSDEITTFVAQFVCSEFSNQEKYVITGEKIAMPQHSNKTLVIALICGGGIVALALVLFLLKKNYKRKKRKYN